MAEGAIQSQLLGGDLSWTSSLEHLPVAPPLARMPHSMAAGWGSEQLGKRFILF